MQISSSEHPTYDDESMKPGAFRIGLKQLTMDLKKQFMRTYYTVEYSHVVSDVQYGGTPDS